MRKLTCDSCLRESGELFEVVETLRKHLDRFGVKEVCRACLDKANDFLIARRKEALDKVWEDTARLLKPYPHT